MQAPGAVVRGRDGPVSNGAIPEVSIGGECGFYSPARFGDGQDRCVH